MRNVFRYLKTTASRLDALSISHRLHLLPQSQWRHRPITTLPRERTRTSELSSEDELLDNLLQVFGEEQPRSIPKKSVGRSISKISLAVVPEEQRRLRLANPYRYRLRDVLIRKTQQSGTKLETQSIIRIKTINRAVNRLRSMKIASSSTIPLPRSGKSTTLRQRRSRTKRYELKTKSQKRRGYGPKLKTDSFVMRKTVNRVAYKLMLVTSTSSSTIPTPKLGEPTTLRKRRSRMKKSVAPLHQVLSRPRFTFQRIRHHIRTAPKKVSDSDGSTTNRKAPSNQIQAKPDHEGIALDGFRLRHFGAKTENNPITERKHVIDPLPLSFRERALQKARGNGYTDYPTKLSSINRPVRVDRRRRTGPKTEKVTPVETATNQVMNTSSQKRRSRKRVQTVRRLTSTPTLISFTTVGDPEDSSVEFGGLGDILSDPGPGYRDTDVESGPAKTTRERPEVPLDYKVLSVGNPVVRRIKANKEPPVQRIEPPPRVVPRLQFVTNPDNATEAPIKHALPIETLSSEQSNLLYKYTKLDSSSSAELKAVNTPRIARRKNRKHLMLSLSKRADYQIVRSKIKPSYSPTLKTSSTNELSLVKRGPVIEPGKPPFGALGAILGFGPYIPKLETTDSSSSSDKQLETTKHQESSDINWTWFVSRGDSDKLREQAYAKTISPESTPIRQGVPRKTLSKLVKRTWDTRDVAAKNEEHAVLSQAVSPIGAIPPEVNPRQQGLPLRKLRKRAPRTQVELLENHGPIVFSSVSLPKLGSLAKTNQQKLSTDIYIKSKSLPELSPFDELELHREPSRIERKRKRRKPVLKNNLTGTLHSTRASGDSVLDAIQNRLTKPHKSTEVTKNLQGPITDSEDPLLQWRTTSSETLLEQLNTMVSEGHSSEALRLWQYLSTKRKIEPSRSILHSLILANSSETGSGGQIVHLLDQLCLSITDLNDTECRALLQTLAIHPDYILRTETLSHMQQSWFSIDEHNQHLLVAGLLRELQLEKALELLDEMIASDVQVQAWLFDVAATILINVREFEEALRIISLRKGAHGITGIHSIWTHLLDEAAKVSRHEICRHCWTQWVDTGLIRPNTGTCMTVMNIAAKQGDVNLATNVLDFIKHNFEAVDPVHHELLLEAYVSDGKIQQAFRMLYELNAKGFNVHRRSVTAPIYLWFMANPNVKPAIYFNQVLKIDDLYNNTRLSVDPLLVNPAFMACVNVLLEVCAMQHERYAADAWIIYDRAKNELAANPRTTGMYYVFETCRKTGALERILEIWQSYKDTGGKMFAAFYDSVIQTCLAGNHQLDKILDLYKELKAFTRHVPAEATLKALYQTLRMANHPKKMEILAILVKQSSNEDRIWKWVSKIEEGIKDGKSVEKATPHDIYPGLTQTKAAVEFRDFMEEHVPNFLGKPDIPPPKKAKNSRTRERLRRRK